MKTHPQKDLNATVNLPTPRSFTYVMPLPLCDEAQTKLKARAKKILGDTSAFPREPLGLFGEQESHARWPSPWHRV